MQYPIGISFQFGPEISSQQLEYLINNGFGEIQIQANLLNNLQFKWPKTFFITDLYDSSLSRSVADQQNISKGFIDQFSRRIRDLSIYDIQALHLDIGLDSSQGNESMYDLRLNMIRKLAAVAYIQGIRIDLPIRIPFISEDIAEFHMKFLKDIMVPNVGLSIDIHPHELSRDFSVADLMKWIKFDLGAVRFIYEPETGNRIVRNHILPWVDFLKKNAFRGGVFFAPVIVSHEMVLSELDSLKDLLDDLV